MRIILKKAKGSKHIIVRDLSAVLAISAIEAESLLRKDEPVLIISNDAVFMIARYQLLVNELKVRRSGIIVELLNH